MVRPAEELRQMLSDQFGGELIDFRRLDELREPEIDLPFEHGLDTFAVVGHPQVHRQLGVRPQKSAGRRVSGNDARVGGQGDAHLSRLEPGNQSQVVEEVVFRGDERAAMHDDALAELGKRDAPGLAIEQAHAKLLFERRDGLGQRRLRDLEGDSRVPEAAGFGEGHDLAELAGVHR